MPRPTFVALKSADKLGLGVQCDGGEYLSEVRQGFRCKLKSLVRSHTGIWSGYDLNRISISPTRTLRPLTNCLR